MSIIIPDHLCDPDVLRFLVEKLHDEARSAVELSRMSSPGPATPWAAHERLCRELADTLSRGIK